MYSSHAPHTHLARTSPAPHTHLTPIYSIPAPHTHLTRTSHHFFITPTAHAPHTNMFCTCTSHTHLTPIYSSHAPHTHLTPVCSAHAPHTHLTPIYLFARFREGARPNTAPTSASAPDAWAWQHAVISFASKVLPNGKELLGAVLPTLRAFIEAEGNEYSMVSGRYQLGTVLTVLRALC